MIGRQGHWLAAMVLVALVPSVARSAIRYDPQTRVFRLDSRDTSYAFRIGADGKLRPLYWGIRRDDAQPFTIVAADPAPNDVASSQAAQEYPGQGGGLDREPSLKLAFANGNRDLVLHYVSHAIAGDELTVQLADINEAVAVELHYAIDEATGIIARSATVINRTNAPVRIDQMMAASYTLPRADGYQMRYLTGRWTGEFTVRSRPVDGAATVLESRNGNTGHQASPWLALTSDAATDEEHGAVWFAALGWSGSWRIVTEQDDNGLVRLTGGFNPYDFAYTLRPGEQLASPIFYGGFAPAGFGDASRRMHRFQRAQILPHRRGALPLRKVLYNSWEATLFDVNEAGQIALADKAAALGVERFVIDDGWFGSRKDDRAGLGDWTVNAAKFPNGLGKVIAHVHRLGMEFGLWVEPEMVNPDSDLYRAHPDWVVHFPGRPRSETRNQLVLNLARPDVRDHVLAVMDRLLRDNRIDFIKWDHNRNLSEPGWPGLAAADQQRLYVDYVRNLYWIFAELRRRHPNVEFESCASGGGRVDLGIMAFTDQMWVSDNTDPFDRLAIQHGFSQGYAPAVMMAWVTGSPSWTNNRATSLRYRFLSAMQGGLGIGDKLSRWTPEESAIATRLVADYKSIRMTVQQGDLYRLVSPTRGSGNSMTLSVASDRRQAVLFTFAHRDPAATTRGPVKLLGLDPAIMYRARMVGGEALPAGVAVEASGAQWMAQGVAIPLTGDYQAAALVLEAVAPQVPRRFSNGRQ